MKPYELIDGGLYKVGDKVVKYDFTFHSLNDGKHQYAFSRSGMGDVMVVTPITFTIALLEPIHLTPGILEKNGFEIEKGIEVVIFWLGADNGEGESETLIEFAYDVEDKYYYLDMGKVSITFNYVHELQHLLRLCGHNELADNFKV